MFFSPDKSKEFALAMIDIQEKSAKSGIDAFHKFVGHDFATYSYGLNFVLAETTKYARRFVEELANLAPAGDKK